MPLLMLKRKQHGQFLQAMRQPRRSMPFLSLAVFLLLLVCCTVECLAGAPAEPGNTVMQPLDAQRGSAPTPVPEGTGSEHTSKGATEHQGNLPGTAGGQNTAGGQGTAGKAPQVPLPTSSQDPQAPPQTSPELQTEVGKNGGSSEQEGDTISSPTKASPPGGHVQPPLQSSTLPGGAAAPLEDDVEKPPAEPATQSNALTPHDAKPSTGESPGNDAAEDAQSASDGTETAAAERESMTPPATATKTTKAAPGDSDSGTAASHCTSPIALLLACAAAAAMVAA
ncbi:leishmanolysin [Trypanosoma rangeli]|uniref:Leishmanolysin n=1 Tax=Trypanosoma rangeli TaxID=5698 RepID=A0A422P3Q6_TRYRA|nr:leishmanolysin [Trypanosoma rangeli]RNF12367.1 leishmanolysin [Trypanosoma rangeli]|eukprot:RNF12367.1 leishmanolysin [Trypanosoma rangeli]